MSHRDTFLLLRSTPRVDPIKQADDFLTAFYRENGPCCAGCDHWHRHNSRMHCALKDVDRYGRPVVQCATERVPDIACEMVKQDHAKDMPRYSNRRDDGHHL